MKTTLKYLVIFGFIFCLSCLDVFAQSGHWEQLFPASSPGIRTSFGLAKLTKSQVLFFGGSGDGGPGKFLNDTWLYDIDKNTWTQLNIKNPPKARDGFGMIQLSDGKVLMFGGCCDSGLNFNDTWLFDSLSMQWSKLKTISSPFKLAYFAFSRINDNEALLFGGDAMDTNMSGDQNYTWIFSLIDNSWSMVKINGSRPHSRSECIMCSIDSSNLLLYGGIDVNGLYIDSWVFNLKNYKWSQVFPTDNPPPTDSPNLISLNKDVKLWLGGLSNNHIEQNDTWLYYTNYNTWKKLFVSVKPPARSGHQFTQISPNKVLLYGGFSSTVGSLNDTWVLSIDSLTSTPIETSTHSSKITSIHQNSSDEINIEYNMENPGNIDLKIYDMQGTSVIHKENIMAESGLQKYSFRMNNAATGVYFVTMSSGAGVLFDKFVFIR